MNLVTLSVTLGALAVTARGGSPVLQQDQLYALTTIDTLPTPAHLDDVFSNQTLENLIGLAMAAPPAVNPGVQLRAIRTLASYCPKAAIPTDPPPPCGAGTGVHDTLVRLLDPLEADGMTPNPDYVDPEESSFALLKSRAAIEALGIAGRTAALDTDVLLLKPFLNFIPNRDLRATAAKAMGRLCNTSAIPFLGSQQTIEQGPLGKQQVSLAISAALRDLSSGQCLL